VIVTEALNTSGDPIHPVVQPRLLNQYTITWGLSIGNATRFVHHGLPKADECHRHICHAGVKGDYDEYFSTALELGFVLSPGPQLFNTPLNYGPLPLLPGPASAIGESDPPPLPCRSLLKRPRATFRGVRRLRRDWAGAERILAA